MSLDWMDIFIYEWWPNFEGMRRLLWRRLITYNNISDLMLMFWLITLLQNISINHITAHPRQILDTDQKNKIFILFNRIVSSWKPGIVAVVSTLLGQLCKILLDILFLLESIMMKLMIWKLVRLVLIWIWKVRVCLRCCMNDGSKTVISES